MEGDLLEVTMDEVQQLWLILHQDAETLTAFERSAMDDSELGRGKEEEGRRRRKRRAPSSSTGNGGGVATNSPGGGSSEGPSQTVGRRVPPSKRQRRGTRSITPKTSPSPVPSNSSSHSKTQ